MNFIKGLLVIFTIGLSYYFVQQWFYGVTVNPHTNAEFAKTAVMVTRYDGRSGGSGVIISSKRNESKILTNGHVCGVVKNGGIVRSDAKKAMVKYYQVSNVHDLCLITVNSNFHINTTIAKEEPQIYDDAIVSGHPQLLPNILTYGHFSGKEMINIMTGVRKCTEEELKNPQNGFICGFIGGIPIIKLYEAQVVSSTIMPGSSGSAVFNSNGEIAGLVFAGSGNFGYGMIVPYEYVANFFDVELPNLPETLPNLSQNGEDDIQPNWKKVCSIGMRNPKIRDICELVNKSLLLYNN